MKRIILASVLVMVFTCSVRAGWIQNGVTAPPSPTPDSVTTESSTTLQETTIQTVIVILQNVLPIF